METERKIQKIEQGNEGKLNIQGVLPEEVDGLSEYIRYMVDKAPLLGGMVFGRDPYKGLVITLVFEPDEKNRTPKEIFSANGGASAQLDDKLHPNWAGILLAKCPNGFDVWIEKHLEDQDTDPGLIEGSYGDFVGMLEEMNREIRTFAYLRIDRKPQEKQTVERKGIIARMPFLKRRHASNL